MSVSKIPRFLLSEASRACRLAVMAGLMAALAACGGGDSSSSSSSGSGGTTGSGGGTNGGCKYADQITSSERQQSNACGIQVSGAYGVADARLQKIIQICQSGQKATADADYAGPYTQLVKYARNTARELNCGGDNGPTLPNPSTQTYHNFCAKTASNMKYGVCFGPVHKDTGGCGPGDFASYTYVSQHSSSSACVAARDKWLKAR